MASIDPLLERRATEEFVARAIVRTYSRDIAEREPNNVIAQSLNQVMNETRETASNRAGKEWSPYYESNTCLEEDDQAVTIKTESKLLNDEWKDFIQKLETEKTMKKSTWKGGSLRNDELTIESLKDFMKKSTEEYENKPRFAGGKVQKYFHKICNKLDAYSALLDLLPSQSQYCSIFCGSIKLLVKASLTHQKTAEVLAKSLADMSEELDFDAREAALFPTVEMVRLVRELYANVFRFLRTAMEWYHSKSHRKLLDSLASDRPRQFSDQLEQIKRLSNNIVRIGNLATKAENRDIRLILEEERKARLEMKMKVERIEGRIEVGIQMSKLLISQSLEGLEHRRAVARTKSLPPRLVTISKDKHIESADCRESSGASKTPISTQPLTYLSRNLQNHIYTSPDPANLISGNTLFAEHAIVEALKTWSTSPLSEILWIIGIHSKQYPSPTTSIAASVANTASLLYIPYAWISCLDDLDKLGPVAGNEDKVLISMLYALIRQVIATLKPTEQRSTLSAENFDALDGTLRTWPQALKILSDVLALAPRLLLIIMDGIERLDFAACGEHYLEGLLRLLQNVSRDSKRDSENRAVKLLFTTAGNCAALNGVMDEKTMVTARCQGRHAKKGLGKMRSGMSKLESFGSDD